jgi:formate dehydrogenase iron-sulfur subunit
MTTSPITLRSLDSNRQVTSRRSFLAAALGSGLVLLATSSQLSTVSAAAPAPDDKAWGVLIDLTRCTGCESCVLACKHANHRADPDRVPDALTSESYSYLDIRQFALDSGETYVQNVKRQCMHCLHPACVSVCTVGALRKLGAGPVTYDSDKCIGCRYCQYACPFGVPAYDWNDPLGLIHKCEMCDQRIRHGDGPACVASCPNGALRFGPRHALLAQAHAQIESNPGRYTPTVYGEFEAGGTSMLYLSAIPFKALGFPTLDATPIAGNAEAIMGQTPFVALGMAALATALHFITRRHQELVAEAAQANAQHDRH